MQDSSLEIIMKKQNKVFFALIGLCSLSSASVIEHLDSLNKSYLGVNFHGNVKNSFLQSKVKNIQGSLVDSTKPTAESYSFSEFNLDIGAHPTENINGLVRLRMHQDWNASYDEGYNQLIPVWWNLSAKIPTQNMRVGIGDVLVHRSKLNLWNSALDPMIFEPSLLEQRRKDAMSYKNLNGVDRHIQGIDYSWSPSWNGIGSEFTFIGARLRTPWWNTAVTQFDNSDVEKWYALTGLTLKYNGFFAGMDQSWVMDKVKASRGYNQFAPRLHPYKWARPSEFDFPVELVYENNTVRNIHVGYQMGEKGKSLMDLSVRIDYATSNYEMNQDFFIIAPDIFDPVTDGYVGEPNQITDKSSMANYWLLNPVVNGKQVTSFEELKDSLYKSASPIDTAALIRKYETLRSGGPVKKLDGNALLVELDGGYKLSTTQDVRLNAIILKNDSSFVSDMAQSSSFKSTVKQHNMPNVVMNSKQGDLNSSSLFDGLYNYVYQVNPTTLDANLVTNNPLDLKPYAGTNNHYRIGFEKNKWSDEMLTQSERDSSTSNGQSKNLLQIMYPQGYATPNRTGYDLSLNSNVTKGVRLMAQYIGNGELKSTAVDGFKEKYSKLGFGTAINLGEIFTGSRTYKLGGSYEMLKAEIGTNESYKGTIISAGTDLEVLPKFLVRGAFMSLQTMNSQTGMLENKEQFIGGGIAYQIADGAVFGAEYSMVKNTQMDVVHDALGNVVFNQDKTPQKAEATFKTSVPKVYLNVAF